MRKIFLIYGLVILAVACKSSKKASDSRKERKRTTVVTTHKPSKRGKASEYIKGSRKAQDIVDTALQYSGVRYKYGGISRKGMDCSGLIYTAYGKHDVSLQRVSYKMANQGKKVRLREVNVGDLLFFKTSKKNRINHVGLVVSVETNGIIKFIHATTSRGVIISSLREGYWNHAFVKATRVL